MDNNNDNSQLNNNYNQPNINHSNSKLKKTIFWVILIIIIALIVLTIFNSAYNNGSTIINA